MGKKIIEFPENWEEVQPVEWVHLMKIFFRMIENPHIALIDIKREWVRFVLNNRKLKQKGTLEYYHLVQKLVDTLDWMFVEEDNQIAVNYNSTVNLLPRWENLVGPADHGADLSFGEFRMAVQMMNTYTITHEDVYLVYLAGILYRREKHGERIDFNAGDLNKYSLKAVRVPKFIRYAIYLWMASFCTFLLEGTFVIDGSEVCFATIFGKNSSNNQDNKSLGMNSILFSVAESGVFGSVEQVDKAPFLKVLLKLVDDKNKADSLLEASKKEK